MFQFTTTHVVNDLQFDQNVPLVSSEKGKFSVKGVNNFIPESVTAMYKAEYIDPKLEKYSITLSDGEAKKGDTLRLTLYIRLTQSDNSSYYANDTQFKGRPFTVEFPWMDNAATTIKNLKDIIVKYSLLVFEKPIVSVETAGSKITLTAINEFQRFHTCKVEKFVESDKLFSETWEEIGEVLEEQEGVEGFGTYGYILRNIKLPTHEHTRAWAPKANEMPIPGGKYNQYTLHYCVERGPLGMNAVGQNVTSTTVHVFYVLDTLAANFESLIKDAGIKLDIVNKTAPKNTDAPEED